MYAQAVPRVGLATAIVATMAMGPTGAAVSAAAAQADGCDRSCLAGVMTQYLDALVARNPAALPLAPGARATENRAEVPPGDGDRCRAGAAAGSRW